jgi:hypothetical protein
MGISPEPQFTPMESFCNVCDDAEELDCVIHLFMYGVNTLGAGWIGPHTDYSYFHSCYVGLVNQCVTFSIR